MHRSGTHEKQSQLTQLNLDMVRLSVSVLSGVDIYWTAVLVVLQVRLGLS